MTDDPMILHETPKAPRRLPSAGMQPAVCYHVEHMGQDVMEPMKRDDGTMSEAKLVNKFRLFFELGETLPDDAGQYAGLQFTIASRNITLSTFKQSALAKILKAWLGMKEDELEGFDVRSLRGRQALLNIQHQERRDGKGSYAVIAGYNPPMKGQPAVPITITELSPRMRAWIDKDKAELASRVESFLKQQDAQPEKEGFDEVPF